MTKKKKN